MLAGGGAAVLGRLAAGAARPAGPRRAAGAAAGRRRRRPALPLRHGAAPAERGTGRPGGERGHPRGSGATGGRTSRDFGKGPAVLLARPDEGSIAGPRSGIGLASD